jgi:hypothetical protein
VPHSTALHATLDGAPYLTGPLARYSLNSAQLSPLAREAATAAGPGPTCRNPFRSIVVRAVETAYAVDEALRLIDAYERPSPAWVPVPSASTHGLGVPDALGLAEALGRAPARLVVFAVEAADLGFGTGLSQPVAEPLPDLTRQVLDELG